MTTTDIHPVQALLTGSAAALLETSSAPANPDREWSVPRATRDRLAHGQHTGLAQMFVSDLPLAIVLVQLEKLEPVLSEMDFAVVTSADLGLRPNPSPDIYRHALGQRLPLHICCSRAKAAGMTSAPGIVDFAANSPDAIGLQLAAVNARLSELVPHATAWPAQLHAAQRHALLAPGKRFRPLLCLMVSQGCGQTGPAVLDAACVSELVHAASLILDDLPCMDDADLRRNLPTTHVAFNESTAILTATALLNRAFGILMGLPVSAEIRVQLGDSLSYAVGSKGLIAGQVADLANTDHDIAHSEVERLNGLKTGALFDFAIDAAAILAGVSAQRRSALRDFSQQLGLAFQLLDDLKDVLLADAQAEKTTGRDEGKATLVSLSGIPEARQRLDGYMHNARAALERAGLTNSAEMAALLDKQFAVFRD